MRAAVLIGILLLLPALAAPPKHTGRASVGSGKAKLGYPEPASASIKTKDGATYIVRLVAEPTVRGTIANLVLHVARADAGDTATNLLDPPGNWHGYQPYAFAATDFRHGAAQSLYGTNRTICRFSGGIQVGIVVKQAAIAVVPQTTEREFTALVLDVAIEQMAVGDGHPVCI